MEENVPGRAVLLCRNTEDLREALLYTEAGRAIVVLRIMSDAEIPILAGLRRFLSRMRIVIVHHGLDAREIDPLYNLHPRFLGHEELEILPFYQVLARMLETHGQ